jgi:hydroxymethylglutaryl-CoA lyase
MVVRDPTLPERVTIYEVGARDGLQNEATVVPVEVKAEFLQRLARSGLRVLEATSFVHPRWVPQLADAADLLRRMVRVDGIDYPVLVPNERGLDRALAAGVRHIAIFASATETFAKRNLNRTLDEQFDMFAPVVGRALAQGLRVRGYVSMCFGDPWEGAVAPHQVAAVGRRLVEMGCHQLSLGDTIGTGTPGHVGAVLDACVADGVLIRQLAVHFHDTYGQALANIYGCLELGVASFDASIAGLGGCPYAKGATGNVATEDVVYALERDGVETGVDLDGLIGIAEWLEGVLGRSLPGSVYRAGGFPGAQTATTG